MHCTKIKILSSIQDLYREKSSHRQEEILFNTWACVHTRAHMHTPLTKNLYPEYTNKLPVPTPPGPKCGLYKKGCPSYMKWYENGLNFKCYQEIWNHNQYHYSCTKKCLESKNWPNCWWGCEATGTFTHC